MKETDPYPLERPVLIFIMGIFCSSSYICTVYEWRLLLISIGCLAIFHLTKNLNLLCLFLAGTFLLTSASRSPIEQTPLGGTLTCRITSTQTINFLDKTTFNYEAEIISFKANYPSDTLRGKLLLRLPKQNHTLRHGQVVQVSGALLPLRSEIPAEQHFIKYNKLRSIHWKFIAAESPRLLKRQANLLSYAIDQRDNILQRLHQNIKQADNFALVSAMLFGLKSELSSEYREQFRQSGLMHIFAVSGLHIGIISSLILLCLKIVQVPLFTRYALLPGLLLPYLLMTGLPASAVRAWVMIAIWSLGKTLKRAPISLNSLYAAALVILLADPRQLFLPGFQFSFLIMYTILGLLPYLRKIHKVLDEKKQWGKKRRFYLEKWRHNLLNLIFITLCIFLISLGMNLYLSGSINPFSLIANVFCISISPFLMALALLSSALPALCPLLELSLELLSGVAILSAQYHIKPGTVPTIYILLSSITLLTLLRIRLNPKIKLSLWLMIPACLFMSATLQTSTTRLLIVIPPGSSTPCLIYRHGRSELLINCPDYKTSQFIERDLRQNGMRQISPCLLLDNRKSSSAGLRYLIQKKLVQNIYFSHSGQRRTSFQKSLQSLAYEAGIVVHYKDKAFRSGHLEYKSQPEERIIQLPEHTLIISFPNLGSCKIKVLDNQKQILWEKLFLSSNQLQYELVEKELLGF